MGLDDPLTWFGRQHRFAKYSPAVVAEHKNSCSGMVSNELLWISISMKQSLFWHAYKHVVNDIKMSLRVKCLLRRKQREAFPLKQKIH